ncbi:hypothetical protein LTR56_012933 [Elasticomyces elasticus]|nr:hypothetical protein LTR56_012933 [Elasticomyces elasticus]KAK3667997.1 hypothetical protein LTR22_001064 [Elasticomyces elasticus]KAK4925062.1 hypothetical protein LTR49_007835 [Elasticomyces elasticus]KAK5767637.1 hypothetical protein LTS12_002138 [Elasticomyces elasticus]
MDGETTYPILTVEQHDLLLRLIQYSKGQTYETASAYGPPGILPKFVSLSSLAGFQTICPEVVQTPTAGMWYMPDPPPPKMIMDKQV